MGKHERNNLREWWSDVKWNSKHGRYDWTIPILLTVIGGLAWLIVS